MFRCDCCGQCCKRIAYVSVDLGLDRGDGICKYFDENESLCIIYENRPLICNVDAAYNAFFNQKMSKEEYYALNYEACKRLKELN